MTEDNVIVIPTPDQLDPLTALLRDGARKLLAQAVDAELETFLAAYKDLKDDRGRRAVVRNGYLPQRQGMTGLGEVSVHVPKTRDRSGSHLHFTSSLIPPYLKRTKSVETLLPVLYLKGISTGDFQEALSALLGEDAAGLSAATISRLKATWKTEYETWKRRDLSKSRYAYVWADGIYFNVRGEDDKQCILALIGATEHGVKEFIAICDGYRESEQSWLEMLVSLKHRGLHTAPKLAIGDGALGFWKALRQVYPQTCHQRCWVHKTRHVLDKVPNSIQSHVKAAVQEIWRSPTRELAQTAFKTFSRMYSAKYPQAVESGETELDDLLTFYDFPAEHWQHIRTTNPIESTFATVRLRTAKTRGCGSRTTILSMVFKLGQSAEKGWLRLRGYRRLSAVMRGVKFIDGVEEQEVTKGRQVA
jgi:transposase-like protein